MNFLIIIQEEKSQLQNLRNKSYLSAELAPTFTKSTNRYEKNIYSNMAGNSLCNSQVVLVLEALPKRVYLNFLYLNIKCLDIVQVK